MKVKENSNKVTEKGKFDPEIPLPGETGVEVPDKSQKEGTASCILYGIGRVFESVKDCAVLVHGPKGCANYIQSEALMIGRRLYPHLLSTNLKESDIILGTDDVLRKAIREAAEIFKPAAIVVVTTCATEMIAEDYAGVIFEMQDETKEITG